MQDDVALPQAPPSPSSSSSRTGRLCGFLAGDTAASTGPATPRGQEEVAEQNRVGLLVQELHNRTRPRHSVQAAHKEVTGCHGVPGQLSVATAPMHSGWGLHVASGPYAGRPKGSGGDGAQDRLSVRATGC